MVQVPGPTKVTTFPETVHTEGVEEVSVTVSPEVALGLKVREFVLWFWVPGFGRVIV